MANTRQAAKRARQNKTRRAVNQPLLTRYRTFLKRARAAAVGGNAGKARAAAAMFISAADCISRKGAVPSNRAARHKSRLAALLRARKIAGPGTGGGSE